MVEHLADLQHKDQEFQAQMVGASLGVSVGDTTTPSNPKSVPMKPFSPKATEASVAALMVGGLLTGE